MVISCQETKQHSGFHRSLPHTPKTHLMGGEGFNNEISIMLLYWQSYLGWSVNVSNWTCMQCGMKQSDSESLSLFSPNVCTCGDVFSGVCRATSAVVTGRLSRAPSHSGPGAPRKTERGRAAGIGRRPLRQRQVTLHLWPHPVKWTRGKWLFWRVDVSAFSKPLTQGVYRIEGQSKSFRY